MKTQIFRIKKIDRSIPSLHGSKAKPMIRIRIRILEANVVVAVIIKLGANGRANTNATSTAKDPEVSLKNNIANMDAERQEDVEHHESSNSYTAFRR